MNDIEKHIRRKLKEYNENDIEFLKKEWREWIKEGRYDLIEKKTGANPQVVYDIFNPAKIKSIKISKHHRYEIKLKHSRRYEIVVIIRFDQLQKGDVEVVTYYKHLIGRL